MKTDACLSYAHSSALLCLSICIHMVLTRYRTGGESLTLAKNQIKPQTGKIWAFREVKRSVSRRQYVAEVK